LPDQYGRTKGERALPRARAGNVGLFAPIRICFGASSLARTRVSVQLPLAYESARPKSEASALGQLAPRIDAAVHVLHCAELDTACASRDGCAVRAGR